MSNQILDTVALGRAIAQTFPSRLPTPIPYDASDFSSKVAIEAEKHYQNILDGGTSLKDVHSTRIKKLVSNFKTSAKKDLLSTISQALIRLELGGQAIQMTAEPKLDTQAVIASFAPEKYEVLQHIPVAIKPCDDEFMATFFDANLSSIGETDLKAVENLKALILDVFDNLSSKPAKKLGPAPAKQLAVLREFIRKRV